MVTASTPTASKPSTPLNAGQPSAPVTRSRCLRSGSAMPTSFTPGRSPKTRAWLLPITPTPTTPTRSSPSASLFADCTMMAEVPLPAPVANPSLARWKAAGDDNVSGDRHVLNQRVTAKASPITNGSGASPALIPEEPIDEAPDALRDRRSRPEPDRALEIGDIRAGFRHVAGLHRQQLPNGGLADGLLDQPHHLGHLDRGAVANVVDVPGRAAGGGIGLIPRPGRIRRRRARHQPPHGFRHVLHIGEVPPHPSVVEQLDRPPLHDCIGEQPHRHV